MTLFLQAWLATRLSFFMNAVNDSYFGVCLVWQIQRWKLVAPGKSICDREITGCRVGMDNMY